MGSREPDEPVVPCETGQNSLAVPYNARMKDRIAPLLDEAGRERTRQWLENWARVGPLLDEERWTRVAALTDQDAWNEAQDLLATCAHPDFTGDAGEGLHLQQAVLARWRKTGR